jgi:hypothetical protein
VLEDEVPVDEERLQPREQVLLQVEVVPARLHHAHPRLGEVGYDRPEEVGRRNEVGVEDRHQLRVVAFEPVGQRARLERDRGPPDRAEVLAQDLGVSLGPPVLLPLVGLDVGRLGNSFSRPSGRGLRRRARRYPKTMCTRCKP